MNQKFAIYASGTLVIAMIFVLSTSDQYSREYKQAQSDYEAIGAYETTVEAQTLGVTDGPREHVLIEAEGVMAVHHGRRGSKPRCPLTHQQRWP